MGNAPAGVGREPHHLFIGPHREGPFAGPNDVLLARMVVQEINHRGRGWSASLTTDTQEVPPDAFLNVVQLPSEAVNDSLVRSRLVQALSSSLRVHARLRVAIALRLPRSFADSDLDPNLTWIDPPGALSAEGRFLVLKGTAQSARGDISLGHVAGLVDRLLEQALQNPASHAKAPEYKDDSPAPAYSEPPLPSYVSPPPAEGAAAAAAGSSGAARAAAKGRLTAAHFQVMDDLVLYPRGGVAGALTAHGDITMTVSDFLALHSAPVAPGRPW